MSVNTTINGVSVSVPTGTASVVNLTASTTNLTYGQSATIYIVGDWSGAIEFSSPLSAFNGTLSPPTVVSTFTDYNGTTHNIYSETFTPKSNTKGVATVSLAYGSVGYSYTSYSLMLVGGVWRSVGSPGFKTNTNSASININIDTVAPNNAPTGSVDIAGTAIHGQVLTASNSISDLDGLGSITYTWKADGSYIGTGSTYTITQSDICKTVTATASYTDGFGNLESVAASNSLAIAQKFVGNSGNDTFVGLHKSATKNSFVGGGGNDDITGDSRVDVAEYSGNMGNYTISSTDGLITIADNRGGGFDGTDILHGINLLKFADGMEFVGLAAQRVALSGSEASHTVQVTESKLYSGTNSAEKFVIGSNVSSMILAGEGDTVHLTGSFTDYIYSSRGSALQITKGDFMTTINLAGNVSIETDLGHGLNAKLDFVQVTPRVMVDTQFVSAGSIDASLLNSHAVL